LQINEIFEYSVAQLISLFNLGGKFEKVPHVYEI
jgi:hypothetical protein